MTKYFLTPYLRLFFRIRVEGRENLPGQGPAILASNHISFCDSFFLPLVVPRRVRYVAKACDIETDLGKNGKSGVLKSVATRKAFLTGSGHRIRFVYVPKHTSWLNQIEIWFSILVRRVIKRGNFTSTADLRGKILAFIDYFNRTLAKPFKWTYTGRPP